MFIVSNIRDYNHAEMYNRANAFFDLSQHQVDHGKNSDWHSIMPGAIVAVINADRRFRLFYQVDEIVHIRVDVEDRDHMWVLIGECVARAVRPADFSITINRYGITHRCLSRGGWRTGTNVADLGDSMDDFRVLHLASNSEVRVSELLGSN